MKRRIVLTALCCILPATFLCLYLLKSDRAKWLHVETSRFAVKGDEFRVRVTLETPEPGLYLGADIHGMNGEKKSYGYISGSRQVPVTADKKVYDLSIPVPLTADPFFIFAVIVLSRDGTWGGRISAADTGPIPVKTGGGGDGLTELVHQKTRDIALQPYTAKTESIPAAIVIAITWLAAAAWAISTRQPFSSSVFAAAAVISSAWEVLNCSTAAGNILRLAAQGTGLYSGRHIPQQILSSVIILGLAVSAVYIINSGRRLRTVLPWICVAVYWGISSLQVLSLHEADTLLSADIAGIHAGQLLKLAAAVVCLLFFPSARKNNSTGL